MKDKSCHNNLSVNNQNYDEQAHEQQKSAILSMQLMPLLRVQTYVHTTGDRFLLFKPSSDQARFKRHEEITPHTTTKNTSNGDEISIPWTHLYTLLFFP
jgi:hypothetical protein